MFFFFYKKIYYYLVTCSYIEDVEEHVGEEYDVRDFENSSSNTNWI